ncbi:MAG: aminoacetone oxidase family FAD-binding enzyme [Mollicutes bacterium]|nr:aminoacetone oxidase family FAD-binding enzyme [Mollicutes bacterium]MDY5874496.1 aminoacetone oxidase family FAD-binding enzyme [Bacilli bacterium]
MCDIVIIGGGVSGIVSAIKSFNGRNRITILERNDKCLKKLLLTGNGRCNYFNDDTSISNYHSMREDLLDKVINSDNMSRILDFYNELGIIPKIKNGYYYPFSNQASTVRDALLFEVMKLGISIKYNYLVEKIEHSNNKFIINDSIVCDKVIIATGSCSYPKTGSDGMGYDFLRKFGHNIIKPLPALVQLNSDFKYCRELSGIRSDVILSLYEDDEFISSSVGEVQLTDYGISGICTFNLSHFVTRGLDVGRKEVIKVNFLPFIKDNYMEWFNTYSNKHNDKNIYMLLCNILNYKLVKVILKVCSIDNETYYNELDYNSRSLLIDNLTNFKFNIVSTKDFNFSQVCNGGVSLDEVNLSTFESLIVDGLYITGEVLDINGNCGGYNLICAVISGILVGDDLSDKS